MQIPFQAFSAFNAPQFKPDYSGIVDFLPRAFQSYKETAEALETPHTLRHKRMLNEEDLKKKAFENALNQEFGREMKKAELAEKLAHAQYWNQGGGGMLTPEARAVSLLSPASRENMLARIRPLTPNQTDQERMLQIMQGKTEEDFKNEAETKGIDTTNIVPQFAATTPNITAQQKREIVSAGSNVMHNFTTEAKAPYASTYWGYSPQQIWDQFKNEEPHKVAKFLAARAMEDEEAIQDVVKGGGNVSVHAIDSMVNKALGNQKIMPQKITPEVFKLMRHYMKDTLDKAVRAEKEKLGSFTAPNVIGYETYNNKGQSKPAPIESLTDEQLYRMLGTK